MIVFMLPHVMDFCLWYTLDPFSAPMHFPCIQQNNAGRWQRLTVKPHQKIPEFLIWFIYGYNYINLWQLMPHILFPLFYLLLSQHPSAPAPRFSPLPSHGSKALSHSRETTFCPLSQDIPPPLPLHP